MGKGVVGGGSWGGSWKQAIAVAASALSQQDSGIPAPAPGTHGYAQSKHQHAYPQLSHRLGTQPAAVRRPDTLCHPYVAKTLRLASLWLSPQPFPKPYVLL